MKAMFIILGILLFLILINSLRIGIHAAFVTEEPFYLSIVIGSFKIKIIPKKRKTKTKKKNKEKSKKPKKSREDEIPLIKRITLDDISDLLTAISHAIRRFRKKIVIHNLKFWFISSSSDPYKTIQTYNLVNNIICILGTITDPNLIIKESDIQTATDYTVCKNYIDFDLIITIRIGQIMAIGGIFIFRMFKIALRFLKRSYKMKKTFQVMEYREGTK